MSRFDVAPLDLVCVHEFAHLAVARAFGAAGFVRVVRVGGSDARPCYAGMFQMHGALDECEWRRVALAGTLAELVVAEPSVRAASAHAALAAGAIALSSVDAQLAQGFDGDDVAATLALVRRDWRTIEADARERCATMLACREGGGR